jgi:hypothetical protein
MTIATLEPITSSGWYEKTDGTVARYLWCCSRLVETESVSGWEGVSAWKTAREAAIDEALACPSRCDAGAYVSAMRTLHPH